jgi:hypothetical protein
MVSLSTLEGVEGSWGTISSEEGRSPTADPNVTCSGLEDAK